MEDCPFKPSRSRSARRKNALGLMNSGDSSAKRMPAIEDFNCPLLMKRKPEDSTEYSGKTGTVILAFEKVVKKKPKVAYDGADSATLAKATLFGPVANRNSIFNFAIHTNQEDMVPESMCSRQCNPMGEDPCKLPLGHQHPSMNTEGVERLVARQGKFLEEVHSETKKGIYSLYSMVLRSNQFMKEMLDRQRTMEGEIIKLRESNEQLK